MPPGDGEFDNGAMQQLPLVPIVLVDEQPADRSISKDLLWTGHDEQGRRYALKTSEPRNESLPLVEWLCYHLCAMVGILTPDFNIVTRIDGTLAFGSRWEIDARQFSPARVSEAEFTTWLKDTKSDIGGMLALDAFMPNEDRHFGNMLFVDTGARLRALAFDWSRTHIFSPWPWPDDCKTERSLGWLHSSNLFDGASSKAKLARLASVDGQKIQTIVNTAPASWRRWINADELALWWDANKMTRIEHATELLKP